MIGELKKHSEDLKKNSLSGIIEKRNKSFVVESEYMYLDAARNYLSDDTWALAENLLTVSDFKKNRNKLFTSQILNYTENRSSDHIALRDFNGLYQGKKEISIEIKTSLEKMKNLVEQIHSKKESKNLMGNIEYVVSIGIGGSDLGPRMVVDALEEFRFEKAPEVLFISTLDDYELNRILKKINLGKTLFISVSKSLSTQETLKIANFFISELKKNNLDFKNRFIQATANKKAPEILGIPEENCIYFPESIGGRFSLWSSTGFAIAIYLGYEQFVELLKGASDMDRQFLETEPENNMPVLMAFIEFWYTNYFNSSFLTVNAYTERLRLFPMYLQQLQMESNGKCIDINNNPVKYKTAEAVFGVTGTPAQHSYFQALHQGTNFFHTDFIGLISRETDGFEKDHNDFLFSNMLAQAKTMTIGLKSAMENEIPRYKEIPGGKPSNIILLKNWNPRTLGNLIALYEHKTFTLGNILEIDSFDQWGVERGKKIANVISEYMKTSLSSEKLDKTTINTIRYFKNQS